MTSTTRALGRFRSRRAAGVGIVAAGALLLAACGDDGDGGAGMSGMDHGGDSSSSAPAEAGQADEFNDADVTFAQSMIPHHRQAVEMAQLADDRAADPEIKKLAEQIEKAQDPEIKTMTGWLKEWGEPTEMPDMDGMDHPGMSGMMSEEDMKELESAQGAEFDRAFAEMMIEHHEGAIAMAEDEQKNGENADAKKLAGAIVEGQSAEVEKFQDILDRL